MFKFPTSRLFSTLKSALRPAMRQRFKSFRHLATDAGMDFSAGVDLVAGSKMDAL